jgi:hypothetical protein
MVVVSAANVWRTHESAPGLFAGFPGILPLFERDSFALRYSKKTIYLLNRTK